MLSNLRQQFIEFVWHAPLPPPEAHTNAGPHPDDTGWTPGHVLLQTIDYVVACHPALRPAEHAVSLLDDGSRGLDDRRIQRAVCGSWRGPRRRAAPGRLQRSCPPPRRRRISAPRPEVSMLLDFSARPFDPIELDRMLSVAKQVAEHVPRRG